MPQRDCAHRAAIRAGASAAVCSYGANEGEPAQDCKCGDTTWLCNAPGCFAPQGQCVGTQCCRFGEWDQCCDGHGTWTMVWNGPRDLSVSSPGVACGALRACEQKCSDAPCIGTCQATASARARQLDDALDT